MKWSRKKRGETLISAVHYLHFEGKGKREEGPSRYFFCLPGRELLQQPKRSTPSAAFIFRLAHKKSPFQDFPFFSSLPPSFPFPLRAKLLKMKINAPISCGGGKRRKERRERERERKAPGISGKWEFFVALKRH